MITLITGKQASGKTTTARQITKGKKAVWMSGSAAKDFCLCGIDKGTECLVIDDVQSKSEISDLLESAKVNRLKLVIVSQNLTREDFQGKDIQLFNC